MPYYEQYVPEDYQQIATVYFVDGQGAVYPTGPKAPIPGSQPSTGYSSSQEPVISTTEITIPPDDGRKPSGGDFYVVIYIQQVRSSTAGKIKYQAQAYFYYAPYLMTCWAHMNVYLGTDTTGQRLLSIDWQWERSGDSGYHTYFSPWFDMTEIDNASSLNFYATCQPHNTKPVTTNSYFIIPHNSYTLSTVLNEHVTGIIYTISDKSGIHGENRICITDPTAIVYAGDEYGWGARVDNGYKIDPDTGTGTVNGDVLISPVAQPMATLRVKETSGWGMYLVHIRRNGQWVRHRVRIRNNGVWENYS